MAGNNQQVKEPATSAVELSMVAGLVKGNEGLTTSLQELFELQKRRELIQVQEAEERQRQKIEAKRQEDIVRKEGRDAALREMKMKQAKQKNCDHRREDGKPYTGGVKASSGVVSISCAGCDMVWEGNEFEIRKELGHLYPPDTRMTGPVT